MHLNFQQGGDQPENWCTLSLLWFFYFSMFFLVYQFSSKSGGNCPLYGMHLNFQHGGGGQHESGHSLPVLHF
jgi:hypothetical protein